MKLLLLITFGLFLSANSSFAQTERPANKEFLKISNLSVEKTKSLHKALAENKEYILNYSCIPAQLLVISWESDKVTRPSTSEWFLKIFDKTTIESLSNYTIQLAEDACSTKRD